MSLPGSEQLAEAGGICVTQAVYDQVSDRVGLTFENLGRKSFRKRRVARAPRMARDT